MGVVIKQSIRNIITTCVGFGLGAVNTLFLMTWFLEQEYYGLISYVISAANLVWPFLIFGAHNTLVKFFSAYTDSSEQHRLLSWLLLIPLFLSVVLAGMGILLYQQLLVFFDGENAIVKPYVWTIFVLAFAITYFEVFYAWTKVKLQSAFGNFLKEIFTRFGIAVLLILVAVKIIEVQAFVYWLMAVYILRLFIMMGYALSLHRTFRFRWTLPSNYSSVFKYSGLIVLAGSVASFLIDLDKVMIERFMPIGNLANYTICAYIASVIIMPSRAMHQITYPLTAKLINEKQYDALRTLYRKSALNLFVISGLFFVLILCNVHQLFELISDKYQLHIWVILFIGLTKLYDNFLGNNNAVLYNSDYYRIVLIIGIGMALLAFVLNALCIPFFGIKGAALATFIAVFVYNTMKLWIVYQKFGMHPFSKRIVGGGILILTATAAFYFWEFSFSPIVNIVLKSILIGISYVGAVLLTKLSPDITDIIRKIPRGA
ncbi:polysaccharide biosynthesis C-terminal domain-containing protein [Aquimarina hainanensis]|uniref:Polysaccharide biosynthesis C-terminal domain-containing protein n=1 Tax=Aquimarina hainanensis TaxID=1578017 RepID=A0ABW5NC35_9FLAO